MTNLHNLISLSTVRPNSPKNVKVKEKGNNWVVEWTKPHTPTHRDIRLYYQVRYYSTQDQVRDFNTDVSLFFLSNYELFTLTLKHV